MDSDQFDRFTRAISGGRLSRRHMVRGLFAGAAAGIPLFESGPEALGRKRKRRRRRRLRRRERRNKGGDDAPGGTPPFSCGGDSCDGSGSKGCGGDNCQCYLAAEGGEVCASAIQITCNTDCDTDLDCLEGHVCVVGGLACCGNKTYCQVRCEP